MTVNGADFDVFKWLMGGMMALMVAAVGWMAQTMFALSISTAQLETKLETVSVTLTTVVSDRYTARDAAGDWSRQHLLDQQQAGEIQRIEARMSEWNGRLSSRISAIEKALRESGVVVEE